MSLNQDKIAVIGMACRYPGAANIHEFWNNLIQGKETIKHFTDEDLAASEPDFDLLKTNPNFIRARGILEDIDKFDAHFFGFTPKEASLTDPQHRVWLETAWEAFEDAGIDPFTAKDAIGIFAGGYVNTYLLNNILRDPLLLENYIRLRSTESFQLMTGNDIAYLPTKTAYKFNLRGPAINIQTACSTSLVAISQACQSLFSFESDICIAGGVCILVPQETGYLYQEGAIPSPDGHCRPFDAQGNGTVFSNGIGIVLLKRLEDAIRDHDRIYATVNGWAINNDGNKKVSFTAPSVDGQSEVILMAQKFAGISPDAISYIEAHGTATHLGDPIEIAALTKAFSAGTDRKQFCGIGSVKSNIGHTDAAAGVASFIKACLSIYHKTIPPTLHYSAPNPHINFSDTPFFVQDKLTKWDSEKPLIIGVSSFGIGGTNAHLILEETLQDDRSIKTQAHDSPQLLVLSAKTESALKERKKQLREHLKQNPDQRLTDLAFTLNLGRSHMSHRSYVVASSTEDILNENSRFSDSGAVEFSNKVCFVFPGQGAQYIGMGKQLYHSSGIFKQHLDDCFQLYKTITGESLEDIVFTTEDITVAEEKLAQTQYTQSAIFIIEYSLAKLYGSYGIEPSCMIGHSIGEYTAACLAGVFDLPDALKIVTKRGQLMQAMPHGKMMAVRTSCEKLAEINHGFFELAADNALNMCTISYGDSREELIKDLLSSQGIAYIPIHTSHAFHSEAFDPILLEFEQFMDQFTLQHPSIPFISCLTGNFITNEQACSGAYWAQQLRKTVRFNKGISSISWDSETLFLEVGPNMHLSPFIRQNPDVRNKKAIVCSLAKPDPEIDEHEKIVMSLGALWSNGLSLDFNYLTTVNQDAQKISLPSYPWERVRCWVDYIPKSKVSQIVSDQTVNKLLIPEEDSPVSRSDKVNREIKKILIELSGFSLSELDEEIKFSDFGFDSLFLAHFARKLEQKYNTKILFKELAHDYSSVKKLTNHIISQSVEDVFIPADKELKNLVFLCKEGNKTPLVLVHGGNSVNFLPKYFNRERPILNYFDLGSDGEKITIRSFEEMAELYIEQLIEAVPKGPYIFCGFSFGGLLAFKMAEVLQKRSPNQVSCIIMFDTKTPQAKYPSKFEKLIYINKNKIQFLVNALKWRLKRNKLYFIYLFFNITLPVKYRNKYILSIYDKFTAHYIPTKVDIDLLAFRSIENLTIDPHLGWDPLVKSIEIIPIEGDHVSILFLEKNYRIISEKIIFYLKSYEK
jgi:acyl transferase domain-containing protein/surfactin synthase thioesterase subunit